MRKPRDLWAVDGGGAVVPCCEETVARVRAVAAFSTRRKAEVFAGKLLEALTRVVDGFSFGAFAWVRYAGQWTPATLLGRARSGRFRPWAAVVFPVGSTREAVADVFDRTDVVRPKHATIKPPKFRVHA